MQMRPFSFSEKKTITELLSDMGFRSTLTPENKERFSIINDSIITLSTKYPISIGLKLNVPFDVVSFHNAFMFQPRVLNTQTLDMINFLATNIQFINNKLVLEHIFPIEQKKEQFLELLNSFMPEYFSGESDRQWLTRIRVALMNKYKLFEPIETEFFDNLSTALSTIGIEPTWDLPRSLKDGIPKLKKDSVLFFKNTEGNEFIILEKGFITYFRDFEQNNIWLRTFFESYSPLLLYSVFKDVENFSVQDLILSWIRFARMTLNPLINVLNADYLAAREFYPINIDSFLGSNTTLADTAIPIPIIARERIAKEELYTISKKLLTKPPMSFNELKAVSNFEETDELIKNGKYNQASGVLAECLKSFNKYSQKLGTVKVLIKLASMASDMKKNNESLKYLKSALDLCKTAEVPMETIVNLQEKIGNIYLKEKDWNAALEQFKIINNFLKAQDPEKYQKTIQLIRLKIAKVLVELEDFKEAGLLFNLILKEGQKFPDVKASYYLEKAKYFLKRKQVSNAMQLLKQGAIIEDAPKNILSMIHFELGLLYLYDRNLGSKAQAHFLAADKLIGEESAEDLFFKVKLYESLSDAFSKTKDREESNYYMERARQIIKLLQIKGLY